MQPPAQELVAKDLHDNTWAFRHIYRGIGILHIPFSLPYFFYLVISIVYALFITPLNLRSNPQGIYIL
jgi:hypothetical protein